MNIVQIAPEGTTPYYTSAIEYNMNSLVYAYGDHGRVKYYATFKINN